MSEPTRTITGPTYPLLQRLRAAEAALRQRMGEEGPTVSRMARAHHEHGISNQSVVRRDGTWIGPAEHHRSLVNAEPDLYFLVGGGWQGHSSGPVGGQLVYALCRGELAEVQDLKARVRAAEQALGMATIVLAVLAARDLVTWDTDESVTRAAWRLCLAAAERESLASDGLTPARVWYGVLDLLDVATSGDQLADGRRYAEEWLTHRAELRTALDERGIEWGGRPMSRAAVVEWLGITASTWSAYMARAQAPDPDSSDDTWLPATVGAYRLTSRRGAAWWLSTVRAAY